MQLPLDKLLGELAGQLSEPERLLRAVSVNLLEETLDLIKQEFVDERDPYGEPWQPKKKRDGRKTLSGPTSRLKGGWHRVRVDERGYEVAPSVNYASPHQNARPGGRLPRRMMVPDDLLGLPPTWQRVFEETATDVIAEHFR